MYIEIKELVNKIVRNFVLIGPNWSKESRKYKDVINIINGFLT